MSHGQPVTIPIAGGYAQSVTLTYSGESSYRGFSTYSVSFEYTYHGVPTGYSVKAEVDQSTRIPVLLAAELAIGHVEMIYE